MIGVHAFRFDFYLWFRRYVGLAHVAQSTPYRDMAWATIWNYVPRGTCMLCSLHLSLLVLTGSATIILRVHVSLVRFVFFGLQVTLISGSLSLASVLSYFLYRIFSFLTCNAFACKVVVYLQLGSRRFVPSFYVFSFVLSLRHKFSSFL